MAPAADHQHPPGHDPPKTEASGRPCAVNKRISSVFKEKFGRRGHWSGRDKDALLRDLFAPRCVHFTPAADALILYLLS